MKYLLIVISIATLSVLVWFSLKQSTQLPLPDAQAPSGLAAPATLPPGTTKPLPYQAQVKAAQAISNTVDAAKQAADKQINEATQAP